MTRSLLPLAAALLVSAALAFSPVQLTQHVSSMAAAKSLLYAKRGNLGGEKITAKRRKQLGINDDEDEYDLDFALENNTYPLISKIIAGSLILTILSLLVVGVIIPSLTDYGEGVCNPLLTAGRC